MAVGNISGLWGKIGVNIYLQKELCCYSAKGDEYLAQGGSITGCIVWMVNRLHLICRNIWFFYGARVAPVEKCVPFE